VRYDSVFKSGKSVIQHGELNDRVYLMSININDIPYIMNQANYISEQNKYGKIYAKVPGYLKNRFEADNYITEATIPGFFSNRDDCHFMAKFKKSERAKEKNIKELQKIIKISTKNINCSTHTEKHNIKRAKETDAHAISDVFEKTLSTYPFPLYRSDYIRKLMDNDVVFYIAYIEGKVAGISSYKLNIKYNNADVNDFVVLEEYRNRGIAKALLVKMEEVLKEKDITTFFTVTRAGSFPMNRIFSCNKYTFAGTLINNTKYRWQNRKYECMV
jgi:putative beta-lysine N-acetyltransferase